jgi:hypothetical protein
LPAVYEKPEVIGPQGVRAQVQGVAVLTEVEGGAEGHAWLGDDVQVLDAEVGEIEVLPDLLDFQGRPGILSLGQAGSAISDNDERNSD